MTILFIGLILILMGIILAIIIDSIKIKEYELKEILSESTDHVKREVDWRRINFDNTIERVVLESEDEFVEMLCDPKFLANTTKWGQRSKYGQFVGMSEGKKIYISKEK